MHNVLRKSVTSPTIPASSSPSPEPPASPTPEVVSAHTSQAPATHKLKLHHLVPEQPKEPIKRPKIRAPHAQPIFQWQRYFIYLPLVLLGMIGYAGTFLILTRVEPSSIQDLFWSHSYFPFLFTLAWGNFFSFSYLFLQVRRAAVSTLLLSGGCYLRLVQGVPFWLIGISLTIYLGFELCLTIHQRRG